MLEEGKIKLPQKNDDYFAASHFRVRADLLRREIDLWTILEIDPFFFNHQRPANRQRINGTNILSNNPQEKQLH